MAKILYAEDDDDISELMVIWLEQNSHIVQLVATGLEALECLEFEKYDLVLLDRNLPGCDGITVCRTFREKNQTTPVIMLTGGRGASSSEEGITAGANEVLFKPPDLDGLVGRISALLTKSATSTC